MRCSVRKRGGGLRLCLMLCLLPGTLRAASLISVGRLHCEGTVYLNGSLARSGSTVYSGDQLRTEGGRAIISLAQDNLLTLGRQAEVTLQITPWGLTVSLTRGQVALATWAAEPVRVEADGLSFSPSAATRSTAEIALREDGSLLMAIHRGKISVGHLRPEAVVVSAGEVLAVDPRRAQSESESRVTAAEGRERGAEEPRTYRIEKRSRRDVIVPLLIGGIGLLAIIPHALFEEEPQASPWAP